MEFTLLSCVLTASLLINTVLAWLYFIRKAPRKIEETYDVKRLLADMASGPALVKMEYLDRSEIFLRSPRNT